MVVPDDAVDVVLDGSAFVAAKTAALRAHATQIEVEGHYFALSNRIGQVISGVEYYHLVRTHSAEPAPPEGAGRL
jgi:N-acetyl-1-D-myo-inositol-2-amino-2-deoxy-alpha-D-glucopyranoside deacetylase